MTKETCMSFEMKYGQIMDLLSILIEASILCSLAQFWNLDLRCFELPILDLVPIIEEYEIMLKLPTKEKAGVHLYKGSYVARRKVVELIFLPIG